VQSFCGEDYSFLSSTGGAGTPVLWWESGALWPESRASRPGMEKIAVPLCMWEASQVVCAMLGNKACCGMLSASWRAVGPWVCLCRGAGFPALSSVAGQAAVVHGPTKQAGSVPLVEQRDPESALWVSRLLECFRVWGGGTWIRGEHRAARSLSQCREWRSGTLEPPGAENWGGLTCKPFFM
jgi:hypothetical protein